MFGIGTSKRVVWGGTALHRTGGAYHHFRGPCLGGRRVLKLAWVINFQKISTIPLLAVLIARYHNTSAAAWIYLRCRAAMGWSGS